MRFVTSFLYKSDILTPKQVMFWAVTAWLNGFNHPITILARYAANQLLS